MIVETAVMAVLKVALAVTGSDGVVLEACEALMVMPEIRGEGKLLGGRNCAGIAGTGGVSAGTTKIDCGRLSP